MKILRTRDNQKLVRKSTGFANIVDFELVPLRDPRRGLTEAGLIRCYRRAHCAEGRDPHQDSHSRFIESACDAKPIWESQYQNDAAETMQEYGVL